VAGALFYCPKAGLQRRVVRVEGILDGLMYVGGPNHLLYLTQLEYKAIYRQRSHGSRSGTRECLACEALVCHQRNASVGDLEGQLMPPRTLQISVHSLIPNEYTTGATVQCAEVKERGISPTHRQKPSFVRCHCSPRAMAKCNSQYYILPT
jgi:hypothetical protein